MALSVACTGGPGGPDAVVDVRAPIATSSTVITLCRGLLKRLPEQLGADVSRRRTEDPGRTAAWGEPPITLTCGSATPTRVPVPLILDDVRFTTERRSDRVLWSTTDRQVTVTLDVPLSYESQAEIVIPLVPALKRLPLR